MSTNFWDVKPPEDDEKANKHDGVELAETPDIEQSDKIQFPNQLKIQIDGQERDFFIENQAKLSSELINAIRSSNEFWIIDIDANRNAFFQMHMESGLIEYWTDGAMQSQQTGDIDDALKHLESILTTGSVSQTTKVELNDKPSSESTEIVPTQQRIDAMQQIDVAQLESVETPEIHAFFSYNRLVIFSMIVSIPTLLLFSSGAEGLAVGSFIATTALFVLAYLYFTRTKIAHFKNQQTYVWSQGNSVLFIYVKEMTDKLLTWTTTSVSTDSDGHTTKTKHHHFRIIDANGGELFSGEGAGGKSGWGRDELIELLGLETINSRYQPPSTKHSVTGNTRRDLDNKENMQTAMKGIFALILVPILFIGTIVIFIIVGLFVQEGFGTYYDDYEMPNRWCDPSVVNYPVTVPLTVGYETAMDGYEPNREDGTYSDASLVTNGGICTYRYRTGDSRAFEFVYELQEVSDIDGISMLVMPHPGGQPVGYSGLEVYTMTNSSDEWELQIDSPYMYGDYERYASYDSYANGFYYGEWFRHAFDNTVENVSVVKIITGNADQLGDRSVSFSGLRVDAAGDYDYPDYLICSGEWDGLFENSTSDMVVWDPDGC